MCTKGHIVSNLSLKKTLLTCLHNGRSMCGGYFQTLSIQPAPAVRAAAFTLFGTLSRFGSGPSEGPFFEQIQTNFVSLLLHLNESDPVVVVVSPTYILDE